MKILEQCQMLADRFDGLVVRERLLLFGSCVAGIYLLFDTLLIMPASKEATRLSEEITAIESKIERRSSEKQVFERVAQRDPDAALKREQLKLQGKLLQLENDLEALSLRLVASENLPDILKAISEYAKSVKIQSLKTHPPEVIDIGGRKIEIASMAKAAQSYVKSDSKVAAPPSERVYRHAISLRIEGRYFEVAEYLKELENLKWKFYWEGLDYKVAQFPMATVDIELYTLSTDEGMLGAH